MSSSLESETKQRVYGYIEMPQGGYAGPSDYYRTHLESCYRVELGMSPEDVPDFWNEIIVGETDEEKRRKVYAIVSHLSNRAMETTKKQLTAATDCLERTQYVSMYCRKTTVSGAKERIDIFSNPQFQGWFNERRLPKDLSAARTTAIQIRAELWDNAIGESTGIPFLRSLKKLEKQYMTDALELCKSRNDLPTKVPEGSVVKSYDEWTGDQKKEVDFLIIYRKRGCSEKQMKELDESKANGRWDHEELDRLQTSANNNHCLRMPGGGYLNWSTHFSRVYWRDQYRKVLHLTEEDASDFWKEFIVGANDEEKQDKTDKIISHLQEMFDATVDRQCAAGRDVLERTWEAGTFCRNTVVSETKELFNVFTNPKFEGCFDMALVSKHIGSLEDGEAATRAILDSGPQWDETVNDKKGRLWVNALLQLYNQKEINVLESCLSIKSDALLVGVPEGSVVDEYSEHYDYLKGNIIADVKDTHNFSDEQRKELIQSDSDGRWEPDGLTREKDDSSELQDWTSESTGLNTLGGSQT